MIAEILCSNTVDGCALGDPVEAKREGDLVMEVRFLVI